MARPDVLERVIGGLPALEMGAGPPLVVLPGLAFHHDAPHGVERRVELAPFEPLAVHRRVVRLSRRRGLDRPATMAGLATDYAVALRAAFDGPVDVLGVSTGGSIAQQLAADHPDVVARLVLVSTAIRLSPEGRTLQRRVAARAEAGATRQAAAVLVYELVPPRRGRVPAAVLARLVGDRFPSRAGDMSDMVATIEAEDSFDLTARAAEIRGPTLVVAGAEDRFYGPELPGETARLIPGARLVLYEGRGHITVMTDKRFSADVEAFLSSPAVPPPATSTPG